jgi:hypothetical protein
MDGKCQHDCNRAISGPESSSQQAVSDDDIDRSGVKENACEGEEIIDEIRIPFYCNNLEFGQDDSQDIEHAVEEDKGGVNP